LRTGSVVFAVVVLINNPRGTGIRIDASHYQKRRTLACRKPSLQGSQVMHLGFLEYMPYGYNVILWPGEVVVSDVAPPSWGRSLHEFHCKHCGAHQAYRSRPRGLFEKRVLPLFLLKPVRCENCFHRVYVFRSVRALERPIPVRKLALSEQVPVSSPGERIA